MRENGKLLFMSSLSGFEATHHISYDGNTYSEMTCSYTQSSGVILVKEEFISAMADEK